MHPQGLRYQPAGAPRSPLPVSERAIPDVPPRAPIAPDGSSHPLPLAGRRSRHAALQPYAARPCTPAPVIPHAHDWRQTTNLHSPSPISASRVAAIPSGVGGACARADASVQASRLPEHAQQVPMPCPPLEESLLAEVGCAASFCIPAASGGRGFSRVCEWDGDGGRRPVVMLGCKSWCRVAAFMAAIPGLSAAVFAVVAPRSVHLPKNRRALRKHDVKSNGPIPNSPEHHRNSPIVVSCPFPTAPPAPAAYLAPCAMHRRPRVLCG